MTYYVYSNLNHDGREYRPGERIELAETAATSLMTSGVIGTEPIREEAIAAPEEQEAHQMAEVGGETMETGEPSIDTQEDAAPGAPGEDITPQVLERMTRTELEELARKQGIAEEAVAAAPNKSAVIDLIKEGKAEAAEVAPENDPSANL